VTALARLQHSLGACGSTRQLGLMRITLAWLLWSTWGYGFVFHFDLHPDRIALGASFFAATWLLFIGFASRFAAAWAAVTMLATTLQLGEPTWTIWSEQHRQLTMLRTGLFTLSPSGRSLSLDRWFALRRAERRGEPAPAERAPLWTLLLIRVFAGTVLLVTTLSFCDAAWLSGEPAARALFGGTRVGAVAPLWATLIAWGLLAAHGFVTVGVWLPPTKGVALALGGTMYLLLYVALPLATLSLTVCWLLFAFVSAEAVHRGIDRMHGRT
jgi:hypothetical protein